MSTLAEVVEQIKQSNSALAALRVEITQLQRDQQKAGQFVGPLTPHQAAQASYREQRLQAADEEQWGHTKRLYTLGEQRSQLQGQHNAQVSQGNALMNLIRHIPGGSTFAGSLGNMSGILGNLGKTFPALGTAMQGMGVLGGGGASIGAAAGGGGGIAGLLGGAGGALGAAAGLGPIGIAVGASVALGTALASIPGKIRDWGQSLLDSQRHLAEFSGAMAVVFAHAENRDYFRNMSIGDQTAGSTGFLANSLGDLKDSFAPIEILLTDLKNMAAGFLGKLVTPLVDGFGVLATLLDGMLKLLGLIAGKEEGPPIRFDTWLEEVAGGNNGVGPFQTVFGREKHKPAGSQGGNDFALGGFGGLIGIGALIGAAGRGLMGAK